jgi:hypothetical protein
VAGTVPEDVYQINKNNIQLIQSNGDIMRLTNDGKFKCTVNLTFKESDSIFFIDPSTIDLEEGETQDIKIWAFPTGLQEFKNTIIATVPLNPVPLEFNISCLGVEPGVSMDGPWTEILLQVTIFIYISLVLDAAYFIFCFALIYCLALST